ncbi:MAG: DUF1772 domain-containing protein [Proteobacteria bacterium]|nr:MAG: DUF1772 domain-containing protein [Pseudomonadota bacterium]
MLILNVATIVCIGLMIGTEFAVSAFINPVLWKLDDHAQMNAIRMFAARLGFVMPFWYGLGLLLLLAEMFAMRHEPDVVLLSIASGIWVLVIVLTVLFLVPVNNQFARAEPGPVTQKAQRDHHKWDRFHRLRVLALTASMVLFLVAIL